MKYGLHTIQSLTKQQLDCLVLYRHPSHKLNTQTSHTNKNNEGSFQIRYTYIVDALIPQTISQLNSLSQKSFGMENNADG
jgi:hypothetical protein